MNEKNNNKNKNNNNNNNNNKNNKNKKTQFSVGNIVEITEGTYKDQITVIHEKGLTPCKAYVTWPGLPLVSTLIIF